MSIFNNEDTLKESSRFKEVVTPHKLSVLILVYEYCSLKPKSAKIVIPKVFGEEQETSQLTQKEMRNFMISALKLLQTCDIDLKELLTKQRFILNPTLMDTLQLRLREIYEGGIQPLCDFFEPLSKLLEGPQPVMTKDSVLGVFIRRMILAYERLSFNQVIKLYDKFRAYYEEYHGINPEDTQDSVVSENALTESMMELSAIAREGGNLNQSTSSSHGDGPTDHNITTGGFYSQKQAEYFIVMQGFRMQYNENEAMPAKQLQEKITDLLRTNPQLAEAHFLSYLNSLRVSEFCTALHNLYHYFDRHTPNNSDTSTTKAKEEDISRRFAALNLASLHYRFGHRKQALAALGEAISMAQESNDHVCLQHALGWLYRLGEPGTDETGNLLERSVIKTQEQNLPYLASLGVQAFARHNALSKSQSASVFESMVASDVLNCQYSQSGFMCVSCVHKAALWHMYGKSDSSLMYNQLALNLETSDFGLYYNGELSCMALCNLAQAHADRGDWACMNELLTHTKHLFPSHSRYAHIWMSCEQQINFTRAMHCGNWAVARQAVQSLQAVDSLEADIREAELKKDCGESSSAASICEDLLKRSCDNNKILPEFKCRVYLLLAQLRCQTDLYTSAISPLLDCIGLAKAHHLSYTLAMASCYMAYVQLCMSLSSLALDLLDSHMTTILTNGSLYDRARVTALYAKCRLADTVNDSADDRRNVVHWAVQTLTEVLSHFRSLDATTHTRNTLYYLALLHNQLGNNEERNHVSHEFKKLDQQHPSLSPLTAKFF